jgi:hypothetical protein
MKPGSGDKRYRILITGRELEELKKQTGAMAEAFGLDRRIEKYQGKRSIGFWRWDLDCLVDVTALALEDAHDYPRRSGPGYEAMKTLHRRIVELTEWAYRDVRPTEEGR